MWKSNYPHRHVNAIDFHVFVAATVKLQKFVISEPNFSPSEQDSDRQHQLRVARLYLWHIMMSALRHNYQKRGSLFYETLCSTAIECRCVSDPSPECQEATAPKSHQTFFSCFSFFPFLLSSHFFSFFSPKDLARNLQSPGQSPGHKCISTNFRDLKNAFYGNILD